MMAGFCIPVAAAALAWFLLTHWKDRWAEHLSKPVRIVIGLLCASAALPVVISAFIVDHLGNVVLSNTITPALAAIGGALWMCGGNILLRMLMKMDRS